MSPNPPLIARPANLADAPSIAHIYNQGIDDRIATFETAPRSAAAIVKMLQDCGDRYPHIVVEQESRVIAWAGSSPYSTRPCYAGIAEFSIYTERAARGIGAGRVALAALIEACEQRGFWKLVSRIFPDNSASRSLCRSVGFREVGIHQRHAQLDGVWRDCVIVERLLGTAEL